MFNLYKSLVWLTDQSFTISGVAGSKIQASLKNIADAFSSLAPLDSPALTGTPTAPTPSEENNSTSIATTAFVSTATSEYLPLCGGTLSGALNMGGNCLTDTSIYQLQSGGEICDPGSGFATIVAGCDGESSMGSGKITLLPTDGDSTAGGICIFSGNNALGYGSGCIAISGAVYNGPGSEQAANITISTGGDTSGDQGASVVLDGATWGEGNYGGSVNITAGESCCGTPGGCVCVGGAANGTPGPVVISSSNLISLCGPVIVYGNANTTIATATDTLVNYVDIGSYINGGTLCLPTTFSATTCALRRLQWVLSI